MFLSLYLVVKVARTGWVEKNGHEFRKTKVARVARSLPACSKFIFGSQGCQTGWVEKNAHEFRKTKVAIVTRSLPASF